MNEPERKNDSISERVLASCAEHDLMDGAGQLSMARQEMAKAGLLYEEVGNEIHVRSIDATIRKLAQEVCHLKARISNGQRKRNGQPKIVAMAKSDEQAREIIYNADRALDAAYGHVDPYHIARRIGQLAQERDDARAQRDDARAQRDQAVAAKRGLLDVSANAADAS